MKKIKLVLSLLLLTFTLSTAISTERRQKHLVYENTFDNWTISDLGKASVKQNCGVDGKRSCFALEGTDKTNPFVTSPKITLDGSMFLFHGLFKCTGNGYLYTGANSVQFDVVKSVHVNVTDVGDGWTDASALLRIPDGANRKLFAAMYYTEGTCYIDKIDLTEIEVISVSEDPKYGTLAADDIITKDGVFESKIFEDDFYTTINPHVKSVSTTWNSNRAAFSNGKNITFDYTGISPILTSPLSIEFQIVYTSTTSTPFLTLMESSDSGDTWSDVGTFGSSVGTFKLTLSSTAHSMFCVVSKSPEGSVQLSSVKVTSTVSDKPTSTIRGKQIVHVPVDENEITVSVTEKLDTKRNFYLNLANAGNSSIDGFTYDFSATTTSGPSLTPDKTSGRLDQGESVSITNSVCFSSSDDNVINYGIHNSDGSVMYASGLFIVTKSHFFDDERYGNYIAEDSDRGTLWWCGSTFKVSKERPAPEKSTLKPAIDLYAAKNEFEAFQFILKASSSDQTISDVSMSALKSVDDSSVVITNVSVRRVMYVKTEFATDTVYGRVGEYWPDPLIPLDLPYTCPANENCPFWVLVYVPFDAKEGSYKGTVSLTAGGKKLSADVSLKVWNFTISKKQRLKSIFGLYAKSINAYHHLDSANTSVKRAVFEKYLDSFSKHRISPSCSCPYDWYSTSYVDGKLQYYYDKFAKKIVETHSEDGYGFSSDVISIFGMNNSIGDYKWGSSEHAKLFDQSTAYFQELLRNISMLNETYVYWFDEPTEEDYDAVIAGNDAIKRGGPDIKILLTEQVEDKLKGHVDAWCPVFTNYVKEDLMERQKLGEEAWTYVCCCPNGKRITLFIDHPADELRLWIWHSFKNNINGVLLWQTVYWTRNYTHMQDPYTDVMSWDQNRGTQWGNGDGKFFYPPLKWNENMDEIITDDPIETVRLEILRDGMEDWEYFTTLKEILASKGITSAQKRIAKKLLGIPDSIVGDTDTVYSVTPDEMLAQRNEVGKFINAYFCGEEYEYSFSLSDEDNAVPVICPSLFWIMLFMFFYAYIPHH